MAGKVCMVTGASSGIGKATALGLANIGATVVMVCRSQQRGEVALAEIKQKSGNERISLLLADLAMKEEGFIEFLPGADAVILDEAHQVPDLATQFFGISLGSRELERLIEELRGATIPLRDAALQFALQNAMGVKSAHLERCAF